MIIGIPKEIKNKEDRVALTPDGARLLSKNGHKVIIENNAGIGSGFPNEEYLNAGAVIYDSAEKIYTESEIIVKIKEPQPMEYKFLKKNHIIFTYLHLVVEPVLTKELLDKKVTSIAYETIQKSNGELPLLIPTSEVAGKMSVQIAANLLENRNGGSGVLLGGVAGVSAGKILIIGAGHVGINAAKIATGMGADVSIVDTDIRKLRYADNLFGSKIKTFISNEYIIKDLIKNSDVVIGAVLIPGYKAPRIITEEMVKSMRKGSVIVDLSIDQGGIVETMDRITTIENPFYVRHGVIHYSVPNIPGSVPRTSTIALTNESVQYLLNIANNGLVNSIKRDKSLAYGVNTYQGKLTNKGVSEALHVNYTELSSLIGF
ncbi:alanine dehydrogenase [bacterium]|nr:alanine dehydrogenase [bacterium]